MDTPFSSSAQVFRWLSRFINLEMGRRPSSFRPERMRVLAEAAGNPQLCAPALHVAGSKGKGSVTAMASSILRQAGYKPARFMSPHVTEYRERITCDNDFFDEEVYIRAGEELRKTALLFGDHTSEAYFRLKEASDLKDASGDADPTFFELLTLYYFLCAKAGQCDVLAVETGMGGRLDPTNICGSAVSVITGIELEHTEFLGETIPEIAGEKAGIIKKNVPAALGEQSSQSLDVFKKTAAELHAPVYYFPEQASLSNVLVTENGTSFTLTFKDSAIFAAPLSLEIPIPGLIQAKNAALAVLALKLAFPNISAEAVKEGLRRVEIPARFERIHEDPIVIIDGAHTNDSALHCVSTFTHLYGEGGILLFACAAGKNAAVMAAALVPHFAYIVITKPGPFKASEPEKVFEVFKRNGSAAGVSSLDFIKETGNAIDFALTLAGKKKLPILCVGSFYLAASIREYVQNAFTP